MLYKYANADEYHLIFVDTTKDRYKNIWLDSFGFSYKEFMKFANVLVQASPVSINSISEMNKFLPENSIIEKHEDY